MTPVRVLDENAALLVKVAYSADPRRLKPPLGGFVATPDGFSTAPQPNVGHTIFPSNDHPSDKATYIFRVTAPAGTTGVANGTTTPPMPNHPDWTVDPVPAQLQRGAVPAGGPLRDAVRPPQPLTPHPEARGHRRVSAAGGAGIRRDELAPCGLGWCLLVLHAGREHTS